MQILVIAEARVSPHCSMALLYSFDAFSDVKISMDGLGLRGWTRYDAGTNF